MFPSQRPSSLADSQLQIKLAPQTWTEVSIGQLLSGKYLLTKELGKGSTGVVYQALHSTLNLTVAVKFLQPSAPDIENLLIRLRSEAHLLSRLNHQNVVRIWDFEDKPELSFLVIEFVEGPSLAELIEQSGGLRCYRAMQLMTQVAEGLAAAHQLNILHRDVKPGNILITKEGAAKLADLGQAICFRDRDLATVQTWNKVAGTPAYMAPEQFQDAYSVDCRADIYALGATFYHAVTGQPPFQGRTVQQLMYQHSQTRPVPPHELRPDIPPELSAVLLTMLNKPPDERYQDYRELLNDLKRLCLLLEESQENRTSANSHPSPFRSQERHTGQGSALPQSMSATMRMQGKTSTEVSALQAQLMLREGVEMAKRGDKEEARQRFLHVVRHQPKDAAAWFLLAQVAGTPKEAVTALEQVIKINPLHEKAQTALQKLKAPPAKKPAECPFCRAVRAGDKLYCSSCRAVLTIAGCEATLDQPPQADAQRLHVVVEFLRGNLKQKNDFGTHYLLGLALFNLRDLEAALSHFRQVLALRPGDHKFQAQVEALQQWHETDLREAARKTILVVDDSATVCKFATMILEKEGYRTITVNDGTAALTQMAQRVPDLVLLDIMMPGADGYQVCKWIRADPRMKKVPVVMLSGKGGLFSKLHGRMAGCTSYITKPVKPATLLETVAKYCPQEG